jgi:hypothetical protein
MTMTEPSGVVSTKCADNFGEVVSDPGTKRTVYAGPHILIPGSEAEGESMFRSGMYPPCGSLSLMSASDISHVENSTSLEVVRVVNVDIAERMD